ncbi:MAG: hypothetical protein IPK16_21555 [Anaerolineales bacterium]|nr:hypothetical protein [Anaerolineales bacterium]
MHAHKLPGRRTWLIWVGATVFLTLAVAISFQLAQRQAVTVVLGPQQVVHTMNPKVGVHTRLTDEVEPWKIKHTLELVREMGGAVDRRVLSLGLCGRAARPI